MPEVVQLRIHGVGGNPEQKLLGLEPDAVTVRVAGDEDAGFYARPDDPHVQGYVWWKLTIGKGLQGAIQGLWILLLPFTLFNVANWMFPEKAGRHRRPARVATRSLMFLLGISLTLTYLAWEYTIVVQQLAYQWKLGGWLDGEAPTVLKWIFPFLEHPTSPRGRLLVGILGVIIVGGIVYLVARATRGDFEQFAGPERLFDPKPEPPVPLLGHPLSRPEALDHPSFWHRPKASNRLLIIHMVAGVLMLGGLVAWTMARAHPPESLELRPWFVWLVGAQIVLILLMLVLYFVGWDWGTHFKFAPPVTVAAASVGLTTGAFTGFNFWLAKQLNLQGWTADLDLSGAFGVGAVAFLASLLIWAGWYWHNRLHELDLMIDNRDVPANTAAPGVEPNGASPAMFRSTALLRSFSRCLERIDVPLTPASLTFVVAAAVVVFFKRTILDWLAGFGRWELVSLVGFALIGLVYRAYRPSERAKVKSLWDATTFWPRRFHPFAVRPYAERAVPEIQGRLYELVHNQESRVVVAAHSQGSVLAYCALVNLARWCRDDHKDGRTVVANSALVTFGCPLQRMHASYFPAYFIPNRQGLQPIECSNPLDRPITFEDLSEGLFTDQNPSTSWTNFYHRTDYVGQRTLQRTNRPECDFELPDPAKQPPFVHRSVQRSWAVRADQPLPIFTRPLVHSYYHNSVELQAWLRILEQRLSR